LKQPSPTLWNPFIDYKTGQKKRFSEIVFSAFSKPFLRLLVGFVVGNCNQSFSMTSKTMKEKLLLLLLLQPISPQ
jgi:hypothetical protein